MDFRIGPWLARPAVNCVESEGRSFHLTPKTMDLLAFLARRPGEVISKAEIFAEVWAGVSVTDDALTRCVGELRRVLQDSAQEPAIIETVVKRGYRVVAPVTWLADQEHAGSETATPALETPKPARYWSRRMILPATGTGLVATLAGVLGSMVSLRERRAGSIAVLPLLNLSGDPGQEYFADGMTEALTSDLSKLSGLKVVSRTSAMNYKTTRKPLRTIASELGVDVLLEGSVLRSGRRVRIVVQLIDGSKDQHLWTETYERDFEDVLGLQAQLAQEIARQVRLALTAQDQQRLAFQPRINPEAHEAYLKGMYHLNKFTPEGFQRGVSYLEQAVAIDPGSPFAHASLALGYSIIGHERFPEAFSRAKASALHSLKAGGPLAEAHAAIGMQSLYYEWQIEKAGRELERALELKPNFAEARRNYAWYLRLLGRSHEGLREMNQARQLEPLVPLFEADLAWHHWEEGDLDAAFKAAKRSIELDPQFAQGLSVAGWVLAERGQLNEALAYHERAAQADSAWKWPLGRTLAVMNRRSEALRLAAELERARGPMDLWGLGVIYTAVGDLDAAFRSLDAARSARFSWMPWISDFSRRKADLFTTLRGDPRFGQLVAAIGIRPVS